MKNIKKSAKRVVEAIITIMNSKNHNGLHFTVNHRGKMTGIYSISTYCGCNERCKKNSAVKGSVCEHCFAMRQTSYMPSMQIPLKKNLEILTNQIIPEEKLPIINASWFRIESFGDIANVTHAINYLNLIRKNPQTFFAWWTKNPDLIKKAFEKTGYEKPNNVNIIRSSLFLNKAIRPGYWFVDKVFTVWEKGAPEMHNVQINCGARSCLKCRRCYEKNDLVYINEELK